MILIIIELENEKSFQNFRYYSHLSQVLLSCKHCCCYTLAIKNGETLQIIYIIIIVIELFIYLIYFAIYWSP